MRVITIALIQLALCLPTATATTADVHLVKDEGRETCSADRCTGSYDAIGVAVLVDGQETVAAGRHQDHEQETRGGSTQNDTGDHSYRSERWDSQEQLYVGLAGRRIVLEDRQCHSGSMTRSASSTENATGNGTQTSSSSSYDSWSRCQRDIRQNVSGVASVDLWTAEGGASHSACDDQGCESWNTRWCYTQANARVLARQTTVESRACYPVSLA